LVPPQSAVPAAQHSAQVPPQHIDVAPLQVLTCPQLPLLQTPRLQLAGSPGQSPSAQHCLHWPEQQDCVQELCSPQVPLLQTPALQVAGSPGQSASPQQVRHPMPVQHFWSCVQELGKSQRLSVPQVLLVHGLLSSQSELVEHCGRALQPVDVQSSVMPHFVLSGW